MLGKVKLVRNKRVRNFKNCVCVSFDGGGDFLVKFINTHIMNCFSLSSGIEP